MRASQIVAAMNAKEMPSAADIHSRYTHLSADTVREAHQAGAEMRKNKAKATKSVQGELF